MQCFRRRFDRDRWANRTNVGLETWPSRYDRFRARDRILREKCYESGKEKKTERKRSIESRVRWPSERT